MKKKYNACEVISSVSSTWFVLNKSDLLKKKKSKVQKHRQLGNKRQGAAIRKACHWGPQHCSARGKGLQTMLRKASSPW